MNRLVLSAKIVEKALLRYTPIGLPVLDLSLRHESELSHEGQPRKVVLDIKARALGSLTQRIQAIPLGSEHGFSGFLGARRNGQGIVFHITELD